MEKKEKALRIGRARIGGCCSRQLIRLRARHLKIVFNRSIVNGERRNEGNMRCKKYGKALWMEE